MSKPSKPNKPSKAQVKFVDTDDINRGLEEHEVYYYHITNKNSKENIECVCMMRNKLKYSNSEIAEKLSGFVIMAHMYDAKPSAIPEEESVIRNAKEIRSLGVDSRMIPGGQQLIINNGMGLTYDPKKKIIKIFYFPVKVFYLSEETVKRIHSKYGN